MSFTNEIYNSILQDIYDRKEPLAGIASRMIPMRNGINMVYAVNVGSRLREAYVSVTEKPEKTSFPRWHGTAMATPHRKKLHDAPRCDIIMI